MKELRTTGPGSEQPRALADSLELLRARCFDCFRRSVAQLVREPLLREPVEALPVSRKDWDFGLQETYLR